MRPTLSILVSVCLPVLLSTGANAQAVEYELTNESGWQEVDRPMTSEHQELINQCRRLIAEGSPSMARRKLDRFIKSNEFGDSPWLPEAYLLRGDAWVGKRDEYKALFDYEYLIREYPSSQAFTHAVERELEIAIAYVNGLKRKSFGMRYEKANLVGEELLVRVQERLPGSLMAERAGIELADYYFRNRDMKAAAVAYEMFMVNYPRSDKTKIALERRIYSNIARFKGPRYDGSGLIEARLLLEDFRARYPAHARRDGLDDALDLRLEESEAAKKLETGRWYVKTGDWASARFTFRRLLRDYPLTVSAAEALDVMVARGWVEPVDAPVDAPIQGPIQSETGDPE